MKREAARPSGAFVKSLLLETRGPFATVLAIALLGSAVALMPPQLLKIYTLHATDGQLSGLETILVFGLAIALCQMLANVLSTVSGEWLHLRLESALYQRILRVLHSMSLAELENHRKSDLLARFSQDLSRVVSFMAEGLPSQLRTIALFIGSTVVFVVTCGRFAIVPLATALVIAIVHHRLQTRLLPFFTELRLLHGRLFLSVTENTEGLATVRTLGAENAMHERLAHNMGELSHRSLGVVKKLGVFNGAYDFVNQLLFVLCLASALYGQRQGWLGKDAALTYPFYLSLFYGTAQGLVSGLVAWTRFKADVSRLVEMMPVTSHPLSQGKNLAKVYPLISGGMVRLKNLSVGFDSQTVLAKDLQVDWPIGRLQAVVGYSGCGKSTFLETLASLRPAVAADPRLTAQLRALQPHVAYVEQRPYFFAGSVRDNLRMADSAGEDEEFRQALAMVGLDDSPAFLASFVAEGGSNFSEGERYRLALARAVMQKKPYWLLDEPFAALDQGAVTKIAGLLNSLRQDKALMIVSHILPTDLRVDMVLDLGHATAAVRQR